MSGNLKSSIIQDFENSFVQNCLILWGEAFAFLKASKTVTIDLEEENISALFFDYIDKSEHAIALNINIADEHRLYYHSILIGKKPAKSASRIDFRMTTNNIQQRMRVEFFIEAKNLIEEDCFKTGRKTKVSANVLAKRYIKTGVDNFVLGKYPNNGCLVGYVLQGNPENIVSKINLSLPYNQQLLKTNSDVTALIYSYYSKLGAISIKHFFLNFN